MKIKEKKIDTQFVFGHKAWPYPAMTDSDEANTRFYKAGMEMFIGAEFLPESPLVDSAYIVLDQFFPQLLEEKRWKNYKTPEMGDMNVATHSLRQAGITVQALSYGDAQKFSLQPASIDMMAAAAIIHDLGELKTTDITYDQKQGDKRSLELAESRAVFEMIDSVDTIDLNMRTRLKEIYLKISTSLNDEDMKSMLGETSSFQPDAPWQTLRKLFNLYEKYGYLITALEQYPYAPATKEDQLPARELTQVRSWNREELENAMAEDQKINDTVKQAVLFKNVVGNQWKAIVTAYREGIPSAKLMFDNQITYATLLNANELMQLNMPMEFFNK